MHIKYVILLLIILTKGYYVFANHTLRDTTTNIRKEKARQESFVFLPDSLIKDSLEHEYTKIKNFAYKWKFTKEIYGLIFRKYRGGNVTELEAVNAEDKFTEYAGKEIAKISIFVKEPYGTSIYDTLNTVEDLNWVERSVNNIHLKTAEFVIRKQLTIKKGDRLVPFEIVQNEIILRSLRYIDDALILPISNKDSTKVNLIIICKDELSWDGSISSNLTNSFDIGVGNKNFMKMGHIIDYEFQYDGDKNQKTGNLINYEANSLLGSHINFRAFYINNYREKKMQIDIERNFLTSSMKWAGGIEIDKIYRANTILDYNLSFLQKDFSYNHYSIWLGHSFPLGGRYGYYQNIYLATRYYNTYIKPKYNIDDDFDWLYSDMNTSLISFAYAKIKYYKTNLVYNFGRTEDVPSGLYLNLTSGYILGKTNNDRQTYLSLEGRYSYFNKKTERYYAIRLYGSTHISNIKEANRSSIFIEGTRISKLYNLGSLKFRLYNTFSYAKKITKRNYDRLYIERKDLHKYNTDSIYGTQKLAFSMAASAFYPRLILGFRTSFTTSVQGVYLANSNTILKTAPYWGISAAINLRNTNLVIKNFAFSFTVYPRLPNNKEPYSFDLSTDYFNDFYKYQGTKPEIYHIK